LGSLENVVHPPAKRREQRGGRCDVVDLVSLSDDGVWTGFVERLLWAEGEVVEMMMMKEKD